ncbi:hypothetical protein GGX14DRAFT_634077, partial [Mycena pura]
YQTDENQHHAYKVYPNQPTHDPDNLTTLNDLCESSNLVGTEAIPLTEPAFPSHFPFSNRTTARLFSWFYTNTKLSLSSLNSLVRRVILWKDFKPEELVDFDASRELRRVDNAARDFPDALPRGWKRGSVKIKVPAPGIKEDEADALEVKIDNILYRPLLDVMRECFEGPAFRYCHLTPFEYRWNPPKPDDAPPNHSPPIYNSPSMLREHVKLSASAPELDLEAVVAAFMFWSDSTHLADFGYASLWPLYTFFGNISKYLRAKPSMRTGYHQAYFPTIPDSVKDTYFDAFGKAMPPEVLTHLKRELIHAVWEQLLLTPEFIHAYLHGLKVKCFDRVWRLLFPRFITYSADYPEK